MVAAVSSFAAAPFQPPLLPWPRIARRWRPNFVALFRYSWPKFRKIWVQILFSDRFRTAFRNAKLLHEKTHLVQTGLFQLFYSISTDHMWFVHTFHTLYSRNIHATVETIFLIMSENWGKPRGECSEYIKCFWRAQRAIMGSRVPVRTARTASHPLPTHNAYTSPPPPRDPRPRHDPHQEGTHK